MNGILQGIPDRSRGFEQFQPKVTWRWSATDNVNVYASWGRGFRSGGFNSIGSEDLINFWYNAGYGGPGQLVGSGLTIRDAVCRPARRSNAPAPMRASATADAPASTSSRS